MSEYSTDNKNQFSLINTSQNKAFTEEENKTINSYGIVNDDELLDYYKRLEQRLDSQDQRLDSQDQSLSSSDQSLSLQDQNSTLSEQEIAKRVKSIMEATELDKFENGQYLNRFSRSSEYTISNKYTNMVSFLNEEIKNNMYYHKEKRRQNVSFKYLISGIISKTSIDKATILNYEALNLHTYIDKSNLSDDFTHVIETPFTYKTMELFNKALRFESLHKIKYEAWFHKELTEYIKNNIPKKYNYEPNRFAKFIETIDIDIKMIGAVYYRYISLCINYLTYAGYNLDIDTEREENYSEELDNKIDESLNELDVIGYNLRTKLKQLKETEDTYIAKANQYLQMRPMLVDTFSVLTKGEESKRELGIIQTSIDLLDILGDDVDILEKYKIVLPLLIQDIDSEILCMIKTIEETRLLCAKNPKFKQFIFDLDNIEAKDVFNQYI